MCQNTGPPCGGPFFTIWSQLASDINKLQITQNKALIIVTGRATDPSPQHIHDKILTLPIKEHLQLPASHKRQKSQHPTHYTTSQHNKTYTTYININPNTINNEPIKTNSQHISHQPKTHQSQKHHTIHGTTLPRSTRRNIAELRTNKCPILHSYLNKIYENKHPSPLYPICKTEPHTTTHLFNCIKINTQLRRA